MVKSNANGISPHLWPFQEGNDDKSDFLGPEKWKTPYFQDPRPLQFAQKMHRVASAMI
jgi:hypothetical protein